MATVTKDFKVKHGLVVEGQNGTINGSDIITEDALLAGNGDGNLNITVGYDAVEKKVTFEAAPGYTDEEAKAAATQLLVQSTQTNISITGTEEGLVITAENGVEDSTTDDLDEGTTNKYFTDQRAVDAVETAATSTNTANKIVQRDANGDFAAGDISATGLTVDDAGTNLSIAFSNDVNGVAISSTSNDISLFPAAGYEVRIGYEIAATKPYVDFATGAIGGSLLNHTEATSAHGVNGNIVGDSDSQTLTNKTLGSGTLLDSALDANFKNINNLGAPNSDNDAATKVYVDSAVANLVDGAPALLDTLNELAAAINDDENFAATIATDIGTKVSKAGDSMTGNLAMGSNNITGLATPTANDHAVTKEYTDTAVSDLTNYIDGFLDPSTGTTVEYIDQQDAATLLAANGYSDALVAAGDATATPTYLAVDINSIAKQVAFTTQAVEAGSLAAATFLKSEYRSAEFLVKVQSGSHTEISKLLLTLDSSDNVAVTEYGVVGTNGSLSEVSAIVSGTDVYVWVTVTGAATITTVGTLLV
jgi:hypothetical protein